MKRLLPLVLSLGFVLGLSSAGYAQATSLEVDPQNIDVSRTKIVRDQWGVPHIYAPTNAEAAYAMAWVQCEDDMPTLLRMMAIANGELGRIDGPDGAALDFMMQFLSIPDSVEKHYERDNSPEYRKVLESYCAGINAYAETHPQDVPRKMKRYLPAEPKTVVQGYVFTGVLLNSFPFALQYALDGRADEHIPGYYVLGSNAIVFNNKKTGGEGTFLDVNSHQPTEGIFSWYEVHIETEEDMSILGGTFVGAPNIFHGVTPDLGWAATLNYTDLYDFHRLEMHPKKKRLYKYDGEWHKLKKRKVKLPVKVWIFTLPIRRKVFDTELGPAIKGKDGHYYAFQVVGTERVGMGEQTYRMNKADNLEEFKDAMRLMQFSSVNFVYADKADNLYYLHNARYPRRDDKHDWITVLPGDTSSVKWKEYISFDEMIQYENPGCGYLANFNHSPFLATCPEENHSPEDYPKWFGAQELPNNRSLRFNELVEPLETVSWDDFVCIKYDDQYPEKGAFIDSIRALINRPVDLLPKKLHPLVNHMRDNFDLKADTNNRVFAAVNLTLKYIFKKNGVGSRDFESGFHVKQADWEESLEFANRFLWWHHGGFDIPYGEFQRHTRGDVNLPVNGAPDVIAATYGNIKEERGIKRVNAGESYIMLARWKDGKLDYLGTVNAYGTSNRPDSPHFTDQMKLYQQQQLKPMTFDKTEIMKNAERVYSPRPSE